MIEGYNDIQVDDTIEAYIMEEIENKREPCFLSCIHEIILMGNLLTTGNLTSSHFSKWDG